MKPLLWSIKSWRVRGFWRISAVLEQLEPLRRQGRSTMVVGPTPYELSSRLQEAPVTESLDVFSLPSRSAAESRPVFATGEIARLACGRCNEQRLPWELRRFGDKSVCPSCYEATLELARAAIRVMPADEPNRLCSGCRALHNPSLGSAWCTVTELGSERARICANFVPLRIDAARSEVTGGRVEAIDLWNAVTQELRATLGDNNYQTWFAQVEPVSLDGQSFL